MGDNLLVLKNFKIFLSLKFYYVLELRFKRQTPTFMLSEEWHLLAQEQCLLRSSNF